MTTEIIKSAFSKQFNIQLKADDPSYSEDWFRTKIEGFNFQLGIEDALFKINVDLDFIGYDEPEKESLKYIQETNKELAKDSRIYLGEQDWYYRLFPKEGVAETIKSEKDLTDLVHDFINFGNHKKIKWMK
jgi:hypothetical protein